MRGVCVLALLGACSFEAGTLPAIDASIDTMPDTIVPTWAVDETSGKAVPATTADWDKLRAAYGLAIGSPADLWLMQETTGSLGDSVGVASLAPLNQPSYGNVVPGWSRVAVGTPELDGDRGFGSAGTGNLDGTAYLVLAYVALAELPPTERSLLGIGLSSDHRFVTISPAGVLRATGLGDVTPASGMRAFGAPVRPIVIKVDPTTLAYVVYTDEERISPTWVGTAGLGGLVFVGAATVGAASARYLYSALWSGPSAQLGDADVKALLQSLGWTVTGY